MTCNGIFEYDKKAFETFYQFGGYVVAMRPKWLSKIPLVPSLFMARFLSKPIPTAEKVAFLEDFLKADYDTALGTIFYLGESKSHRDNAVRVQPNKSSDFTGVRRI